MKIFYISRLPKRGTDTKLQQSNDITARSASENIQSHNPGTKTSNVVVYAKKISYILNSNTSVTNTMFKYQLIFCFCSVLLDAMLFRSIYINMLRIKYHSQHIFIQELASYQCNGLWNGLRTLSNIQVYYYQLRITLESVPFRAIIL